MDTHGVDWSGYDGFDWAGSHQSPMAVDERGLVAEFVAEIAGIAEDRGSVWGWASPPGRFAASVIRLDPQVQHRYRSAAAGAGLTAIAVKLFKTNSDAGREAARVVPFHRDGLARLPGIPNPRVQVSLDAGFAHDGRGRRRGFVVQQWVPGDTVEDWTRRRWVANPAAPAVITSILAQLLGEIVVPLWAAGTIWWDVRDANFCFEADTDRLTMIDVDSLAAYADEILGTPTDWTKRHKGRATALVRLRSMAQRLVLAAEPAVGKTRATAAVQQAWPPLHAALLALGTRTEGASAAETAVGKFVAALTSSGLLTSAARPHFQCSVSVPQARIGTMAFSDAAVLAGFSEDTVSSYRRTECATFRKTNERFGGLSNMASGYPVVVNGLVIPSSEALYQACRFPHLPDVQRVILAQTNPMLAKMKSKPHRRDARPDFIALRVPIMWWCLRVKLACNPASFGALLQLSGDLPIVEDSYRDTYWGATPVKDDIFTLRGANVLGRLLVLLRVLYAAADRPDLTVVPPPQIDDFLLAGQPVTTVVGSEVRSVSAHRSLAGARKHPAAAKPVAPVGRRATPPGEERTVTCSQCFLQVHHSQLVPSTSGIPVCRDCAG